jgi:hypothetical protein
MATAVEAPLARRDYKPVAPASTAEPIDSGEPIAIVDRATNTTYMRGKFLGKVKNLLFDINAFRVALPSAMS